MKRNVLICYLFIQTLFSSLVNGSELGDQRINYEVIEVKAQFTNKTSNVIRSTEGLSLNQINASNRLEDLSQYTAGISASTLNGGMNSSLTVRGFSTRGNSFFLNGHLDNQRMYVRDLDTIESVIIEKGHSSIAYGAASPGGTIQYVTKQPKEDSHQQFELTLGSFDKQRVMFDSTGGIGYQETTYRVVMIKQHANSFMDNVGNDYTGVLGSFQIPFNATGKARVEVQYDELENPYSFGTVRSNGVIQYDKSYVDPRTFSNRNNLRTSLYLTDNLSSNIFYKASINYVDVQRDDKWVGFFYKADEDNLVNYWATFDNKAYQYNGRFSIGGDVEYFNMQHNFEIGVDRNHYLNKQIRDRSYADFRLNVFNPVFGQPEPTDAIRRDIGTKSSDFGVYLHDTFKMNNDFSFSFGARHSKYKLENIVNKQLQVDQSNNSLFAGAHYQLSSSFSIRTSLAESFEPNGGQSKAGNYFKPKKAHQKEFSLDYIINDNNKLISSFYYLEQKNNLSKDPTDRDYYVESGKHFSKGIELKLTSEINSYFKSDIQYTFLKNKIADPQSKYDGNTSNNLSKHAISARLRWQNNNNMYGYFGFVAQGKRYGNLVNTFELPGYGKFDFGFTYLHKQWQFKTNVINVFDKKYIAASYYEDDMYQGRPREFTLSLNYNW